MGQHKTHTYTVQMKWTGNLGTGTSSYRAYSRNHEISAEGKPPLLGSSDPAFRGDPARYNPEEMLVASLSTCHMLWYLHLCADSGLTIVDYTDEPLGTMAETEEGGGHFTEVTLRPRVVFKASVDLQLARQHHDRAHELCFIASSVNFPVQCEPTFLFESERQIPSL
jgi:organic hydroperoxide reductase OsmC/OhrA